jgi:hypothetical protein
MDDGGMNFIHNYQIRQNLNRGISLKGLLPKMLDVTEERGSYFRCDRRPLHGHGQGDGSP